MSHKLFYIISAKHTSIGDTALTLWGPNRSGYTWHKDRAGIYPELETQLICDEFENIAVDKEEADKFFLSGNDFGDKYISLPNNDTVRAALKVPFKRMKLRRAASCRIKFNV